MALSSSYTSRSRGQSRSQLQQHVSWNRPKKDDGDEHVTDTSMAGTASATLPLIAADLLRSFSTASPPSWRRPLGQLQAPDGRSEWRQPRGAFTPSPLREPSNRRHWGRQIDPTIFSNLAVFGRRAFDQGVSPELQFANARPLHQALSVGGGGEGRV